MASFVGRTMARSATASVRSAAAKAFAGAKPTAAPSSSFGIPVRRSLTARILRSPVELSSVSMLPYHSATASALLNSMLSDSPRAYGWTLEGQERTR